MVLAKIATTEVMVQVNSILLNFSSFNFTENEVRHINKMPFSGVCLFADTPSDGIPYGADKPVKFAKAAIENALSTFSGMGVDCRYSSYSYPEDVLTGHDERFKIGVIEAATLNENNEVVISGSLWKRDFYDVCFMIKNAKDALGFSVEVAVNAMVEEENCYEITDFTFTGVAIMYKNLAAFKSTQLAAQAQKQKEEKGKGDVQMTDEQMKAFTDALQAGFAAIGEKLDKLEQKENQIDFSAVTSAIEDLKNEVTASKQPQPKEQDPEPKAGMSFAGKNEGETIDMKCSAIYADENIPREQKAQKMMAAFVKSLKSN